MKTMFDHTEVTAIKTRIQSLTPDATARWGSFTAHGMICHLRDALKYALGKAEEVKEIAPGPPMFIRNLMRKYMPIPKAKIKTHPVMMSTPPEEWEKDKNQLLEYIDGFLAAANKEKWPNHPFFGPLTGSAWAELTRRHIDHHLCQFGA